MAPINKTRVIIGGLAGGLVWFLWSTLVNVVVLGIHYEEGMGSGHLLEEPRYSFFVGAWALTLMALSIVSAWLYASVRVSWGAGASTAIKLGALIGFVAGFPGNLAQAAFSVLPRVLPLWWMIDLWIGAVLATLTAAALYREERDTEGVVR